MQAVPSVVLPRRELMPFRLTCLTVNLWAHPSYMHAQKSTSFFKHLNVLKLQGPVSRRFHLNSTRHWCNPKARYVRHAERTSYSLHAAITNSYSPLCRVIPNRSVSVTRNAPIEPKRQSYYGSCYSPCTEKFTRLESTLSMLQVNSV